MAACAAWEDDTSLVDQVDNKMHILGSQKRTPAAVVALHTSEAPSSVLGVSF